MTDDQTLASLATMPHTQELLVDRGHHLHDRGGELPQLLPVPGDLPLAASTPTPPVCSTTSAPRRRHHVRRRRRPAGLALQRAGYDTGHIGKYLNGWGAIGDIEPPPGWTHWIGLVDPTTYQYTGYTLSYDGEPFTVGDGDDSYQTDKLAEEAVDRDPEARRRRAALVHVVHAARAPRRLPEVAAARAAPRPRSPLRSHRSGTPRPSPTTCRRQPPSYDEEDVSDKPIDLRRPVISPSSAEYIERYQVAELGALAAVDEAV